MLSVLLIVWRGNTSPTRERGERGAPRQRGTGSESLGSARVRSRGNRRSPRLRVGLVLRWHRYLCQHLAEL